MSKVLGLKCIVKSCPHKLHTKKCIRSRHGQAPTTAPAQVPAHIGGYQRRGPVPLGGAGKAKPKTCTCRKSSYAQVAGNNTQQCRHTPTGKAHSDSSSQVASNTLGFPQMTVQQPLLEAYMERLVKESMEKVVKQMLTANVSHL